MRHRLLPLMLVAGTVFALGCADGGGDPTGAELKKSKVPENAAPQAKIEKLITALFPQPEKAQAKRLFSEVKDLLSDGDVEGAQAKALELLDLATALLLADELLHPRDESRADAYTRFYELVREFVGLPEGTAAPVGTGGGSAELPSGDATVDVPENAVGGTVVIKITRKEGDDPCFFPIDNPQLGGCYDYTREPPGDFIQPVTITACFEVGIYEEPQLSLFLLHKSEDASDPGEEVVALKIPPGGHPGDDEDCFTEQVIEASLESSGLANFARARWNNLRTAMAAVLGPQPLHASAVAGTGKRLGGLGSSFTDIGAALPAEMVVSDGDGQAGEAGQPVATPPAVLVTDVAGDPVEGASVHFEVEINPGSVTPLEVITDELGIAEVTEWVLGDALGNNVLRAYARGIAGEDDDGPFIPGTGETFVELETGELFFTAFGGFFDGFETASGWTTTGFWHRSELNATNTAVGTLVDLAPGDFSGGALPSPFGGTYAFWYGQESTGNYIGAGTTGCGGTSDGANSGTLTSPMIAIPSDVGSVSLSFASWFEIESVNPSSFDFMTVSVFDVDAATEAELGTLNPAGDPPGGDDNCATPLTSEGFNEAPAWSTVPGNLDDYKGKNIQLIFRFVTIDALYNGFRGWVIDDVSIATGPEIPAGPAALTLQGAPTSGLRPYDPGQPSERSPQQ